VVDRIQRVIQSLPDSAARAENGGKPVSVGSGFLQVFQHGVFHFFIPLATEVTENKED
jgi:hypothetical protein